MKLNVEKFEDLGLITVLPALSLVRGQIYDCNFQNIVKNQSLETLKSVKNTLIFAADTANKDLKKFKKPDIITFTKQEKNILLTTTESSSLSYELLQENMENITEEFRYHVASSYSLATTYNGPISGASRVSVSLAPLVVEFAQVIDKELKQKVQQR